MPGTTNMFEKLNSASFRGIREWVRKGLKEGDSREKMEKTLREPLKEALRMEVQYGPHTTDHLLRAFLCQENVIVVQSLPGTWVFEDTVAGEIRARWFGYLSVESDSDTA